MESEWQWNLILNGMDGWYYNPGQGWEKDSWMAELITPVRFFGVDYKWLYAERLTGFSFGNYWSGWSPVTNRIFPPPVFADFGRFPYGIPVKPPR